MEISVRGPLDVLKGEFKELVQWIEPLYKSRFNHITDFIVIDYKNENLNLKFYSKEYCYNIVARLPETTPPQTMDDNVGKGYLGCTARCRKPRAGEDWTRGSDLPDGNYSKETWNRILNAIVAYELVKVIKTKDRGAYLDKRGVLQPSNDSSKEKKSLSGSLNE